MLSLSPNIMKKVFGFLDAKDTLRLRTICMPMKHIVDEHILKHKTPVIQIPCLSLLQVRGMRIDEFFFSFDLRGQSEATNMFLMVALNQIEGHHFFFWRAAKTIYFIKCNIDKLKKIVDSLKPGLNEIQVDRFSLELLHHVPELIPTIFQFLEAATITTSECVFDNLNCEVDEDPWNHVIELMSKCDTACVQINPAFDESTFPFDLTRKLAHTAICISVSPKGGPTAIAKVIIIQLVLDVFMGKCCFLDLTDAIIISMEDAERILHYILRMDKAVHFSALIDAENEMEEQYGPIKVKIETRFDELRYVEIKHVDTELYEARHDHK